MNMQAPRPIATSRFVGDSESDLASPADPTEGRRVGRHRAATYRLSGHPIAHWTLLFALVAMWGSSFALTKIAVSSLSAQSVVAARILIASMALATIVMVTRRRFPADRRAWTFFLLMAVFGNCLPYWLISWGQTKVDSGLAGILMAVMPLVTLLLAHFFVRGERVNGFKAIGFALGFLGVILLIGPEALLQLGGHGSAVIAQVAIVGGAVSYAVNTILAQKLDLRDGLVAATATSVAAGVLWLPGTIGDLASDLAGIDMVSVVAITVLGLVSTALAPVLYFRLVRLAGASFLSLINYLIPVWAMLVGVVFLGEAMNWVSLCAMALILSGVGLSQMPAARGNTPSRAPSGCGLKTIEAQSRVRHIGMSDVVTGDHPRPAASSPGKRTRLGVVDCARGHSDWRSHQ